MVCENHCCSQVPGIVGSGRHVVGDLANLTADAQDPSNGNLRDVLPGYFGKHKWFFLCKLDSFKHIKKRAIYIT